MGSRRRSERISLQPLSNPSYEMLSLRSHLPRFCIIYSRCSAYDVPERTEQDIEQQRPLPFCATYSVPDVRKISLFLVQNRNSSLVGDRNWASAVQVLLALPLVGVLLGGCTAHERFHHDLAELHEEFREHPHTRAEH